MKRKQLLWGAYIVFGLCIIAGAVFFQRNLRRTETLEDIIICEDQKVPLSGETLSADESNLVLTQMLAKVPQPLLNMFYEDNWGFALTNEDLNQKFFQGKYDYVSAVTDSQAKTIWLVQNEEAIRKAAIHEMGHYLDIKLGRPNKQKDFNEIWREERTKFVVVDGSPNQAKQSCSEYFAESFQQMLLNPDILLQNTPRTYQYMQNLLLTIGDGE